MRYSQLVKLWEKAMVLRNLTSIDLSYSYNLIEVPDLSMAPSLRTLNLSYCTNLVGMHQSVFVHKCLCSVKMSNCESLENLGCNKIDMPHLTDVQLTGCYSIQTIPEFGERTQNLVSLDLISTRLKKLPESLGMIRSLKVLSVNVDVELPSSIFQSRSVKEIDFIGSDLHEIIPAYLYSQLLCIRQLFLEWLEEP